MTGLQQRTEMRRCGKRWPTEAAARCSKRGLQDGAMIIPCAFQACRGWHVALPKAASTPSKTAPRGPAGFPEPIRLAALDRDGGHCLNCGDDRCLDVHHRRIRGMGGDPRPHTHCLCNAATLCRFLCHLGWAHRKRREAQAQGFVVSRETLLPGSVSVMIHGAGGGGSSLYPACDGEWSSASPAELVSA